MVYPFKSVSGGGGEIVDLRIKKIFFSLSLFFPLIPQIDLS